MQMKGGIMSYNYKKEYAKWKKWKDKEEALLKHYDVPNKKILELREFDKYQFNSNRRFVRNQNTTKEQYFSTIPSYDKKEFNNVSDILDSIEDEALYEYLKQEEPILLVIILLKLQGYSIKEISNNIKVPISTIYQKISKIKKKFHNF